MADLKLGQHSIKIIAGAILSTKIRSPAIAGAIECRTTRSSNIFVYIVRHLFTSCVKRHIYLHIIG